ncbi:hypothetical protein CYMTET_13605 [Cymbomonas tetramitiformis]|uniref:Uncharacterized protein n=1 Tax=Cymbomonas tetramitiformis TaxID=36881 RepID=A0AAE0GHS2_9CHLO|nr:hypothetical protein CYMTET_13605 [Cymbomonas tetramitiformis]
MKKLLGTTQIVVKGPSDAHMPTIFGIDPLPDDDATSSDDEAGYGSGYHQSIWWFHIPVIVELLPTQIANGQAPSNPALQQPQDSPGKLEVSEANVLPGHWVRLIKNKEEFKRALFAAEGTTAGFTTALKKVLGSKQCVASRPRPGIFGITVDAGEDSSGDEEYTQEHHLPFSVIEEIRRNYWYLY